MFTKEEIDNFTFTNGDNDNCPIGKVIAVSDSF
jgi:hypothetical protein